MKSHPLATKKLLLTVVLVASFIIAYFPVWGNLASAWYNNDQYSHGFLIIPICIYILFQKKDVLSKTPVLPSSWGLVFLIFSLIIYIFAYFCEILTITSLSLVLFTSGVITYFYGFKMFKELIFPLCLLLFMIPIPSQIFTSLTIPLQIFVSKSSVFIGSLLGMPIYREGNVIHLPEQTLQVVQACSGLRSLLSLLTLSAVFSYLTLKSNVLRSILFISGIPIAIFVNIIRVLLMILFFYHFNYDLTKGTIHTIFGVVIFAFALIAILIGKGVLSIWDRSAAQS